MPYDRISASGVQHGVMSDVDQANMETARQQAAMQLQELMAQKAMENQTSSAQIAADASKYNTQAQFASQGSFAQRAAQEAAMERAQGDRALGIVQAQMGPANQSAQLEQRKYKDASELENIKRQMMIEAMQSLRGKQPTPGAANAASPAPAVQPTAQPMVASATAGYDVPAGVSVGVPPEDDRQRMMDMLAILNGQTPQDPVMRQLGRQRELMNFKNEQTQSTRANTFGDSPEAMQSAFGDDLNKFGAQDVSMTGWDPGQGDVTRLLSGAKQLESQIRAYYPNMKPEDIRQRVNKTIMDKLSAMSENNWNSGWIQEFLRQRGIAQ